MSSVIDGTCQQIEQLAESYIHALKFLKTNDEASLKETLENGDKLMQIWIASCSQLPPHFKEKVVSDFQASITDLDSSFLGFGSYAVPVISMLRNCLPSNDLNSLVRCSFEKSNLDNTSYTKLLEFVLDVLESKDNESKALITPLFLGPEAIIKFDRLGDNKIFMILVHIYLKLLPPTNILHLQKFYPFLVDRLNEEVLRLKQCVDEDKISDATMLSEQALNLLLAGVFPLCSIRNSFLIMALSPNLIELCFKKLPATEPWFFKHFPILHRNILSVAFTFAKTHEFFVATSSWSRTNNKFLGESPSSLFCQEQLTMLCKLLGHPEALTIDTLNFLIDWLSSLVSSFGTGAQAICDWEELIPLRKIVVFLFLDEKVATPTKLENIAESLKVFEVMNHFDEDECERFLKEFNQFSKTKKSIDSCHQFWKRIPPMFVSKLFLLTTIKKNEYKQLMPSGSFDRVSLIKGFLFQNNRRLFDQRFYRMTESNFSVSIWNTLLALLASDISSGVQYLPSITEITSAILDELNKIYVDSVAPTQTHNYYNKQIFDRKEKEHFKVVCLLSLIEQLDRATLENFYSVDIQKLDNPRLRFCLEMGLDMNTLFGLFNCAYKAGCYEFIVLFATQYFLQDLRALDGELLTVLCWAVRAFVELKDSQTINGLKAWFQKSFGIHLIWLDYAEMLADGKFEVALTNLDALSVDCLNNRDIVTETVFLLRERALRMLLEPSLCHQTAPNFYSQFMRPIGAPPIFKTELLSPDVVLELSSWNQFDRLRTPVSPPNYEATSVYNLFNSLDQIESNLSSMHKIFINFGAQSVHDVLTCLHESEKQLVNLSRHSASFGLSSQIGTRLFPLQIVINLFRDIIFSTNNVDSTHLSELLLHDGKWSSFTRLELGQKITTWTEKIFGSNNLRFTELNSTFIKLSRRTGNLMLANNYLGKAPRGVLNQNILKNNFGELENLTEALKLEILRNDPSNSVGLMQKFFALADLTASHADIYLSGNTSEYNRAPIPIVTACLRLSKLVKVIPVNREAIQSKIQKLNSAFWGQLMEKLNNYQTNCQGAPFNRLLSGSFASVASFLSNDVPKAHKKLADWSLEQVSTDVSCGIDAIRLMPSEEVAIHALCGLTIKSQEHFLRLIGRNDDLSDFIIQLQNSSEFMNDSVVLAGVQSNSFEQLWEVLKKRQGLFYRVAMNSLVKLLEHSNEVKVTDQISAALHVINLLTTHPDMFSQTEATSNWIDRTNTQVWVKIIQQLFSRLNHQNSFVRNTFKSLIIKIGRLYPHAICYPALIRVNNKKMDTDLDGPPKNSSWSNEVCTEIVEDLKSTRPQLVEDLEVFIDGIQKVMLLTSEKWLFALNHLEQDLLRSCKQIEKEKTQLAEIVQSEEALDEFSKSAVETVCRNILTTIEDLYEATCGGGTLFKTKEQERFVRNFKDIIQASIKETKHNFSEGTTPNFQAFRKLMSRLSTSISMQSQYRMKLSNLSPELASRRNLSIPIPGQESLEISSGSISTIQRIDHLLSMLPTKTRPKKIKLIGSDGKKVSFLCKGQEDLRVDEQVSSLFNICNYLFAGSKLTRQDTLTPYSLRSYTVTPISIRSGLIQWIQEPVSIYSIYRAWRTEKLNQYRSKQTVSAEKTPNLDDAIPIKSPERKHSESVFDLELLSGERGDQMFDLPDLLAQQLSQNSTEMDLSPKDIQKNPPKLLRHVPDQTLQRLKMSPIELFSTVLRAKFSEKNVTAEVIRNRKSWPSDILLEVFDELSTFVPSTLISDELWMKSSNSSDWWKKVKCFERSTSISSIVGALLGLGDRHLDNLLLDFSSGRIVHVDFNVSFGKGRTLRVPELVPFRLTRNIVNALGPTKVEGTFRCSAERTMEHLSANEPVITSMLSAFVYDPLPEWISTSKQFCMGNLNIGVSLVVYEEDRRARFAATTALKFFHLYLDALIPRFKETREELENALLATCQLFTEMNTHRLNDDGSELHHFNDRRVAIGTRLKNAIVAHQNLMRPLKPLFRILTRSDLRFSNFMKTYRSLFSNPLVNGHRLLANDHNIDYIGCIKNFQMSLVNAESVYTQLADLKSIKNISDNCNNLLAISCEDVSLAGSIFQEPSPSEGTLNEVGTEIVNNCRMFLRGMNVEENGYRMNASEHVDKLIRDATDKKNLSKMFEGWCPFI